jgi:hypothetical protein
MQKNLLRCCGTDPVGRGTSTLARGRGKGSGGRRSRASGSSSCTTAGTVDAKIGKMVSTGTLSKRRHCVSAARQRHSARRSPTHPGTDAASPKRARSLRPLPHSPATINSKLVRKLTFFTRPKKLFKFATTLQVHGRIDGVCDGHRPNCLSTRSTWYSSTYMLWTSGVFVSQKSRSRKHRDERP